MAPPARRHRAGHHPADARGRHRLAELRAFDVAAALDREPEQEGAGLGHPLARLQPPGHEDAGALPPSKSARKREAHASQALGELKVTKEGNATIFDVGEWKSKVASRKNDDGTISFLTIDPSIAGFEFVVADKDGKRRLITRDAQHEYVFEEAPAAGKP